MHVVKGTQDDCLFREGEHLQWDFLVGQTVESACNAGDWGSIPGSGRSPGEENGNPLQYSCLDNPHGQRGLVSYIVHGVARVGQSN